MRNSSILDNFQDPEPFNPAKWLGYLLAIVIGLLGAYSLVFLKHY